MNQKCAIIGIILSVTSVLVYLIFLAFSWSSLPQKLSLWALPFWVRSLIFSGIPLILQVLYSTLLVCMHAAEGDVTTKLLYSDETYTELVPKQEIILAFTLPPQTTENRNYIIIIEGHYYTIET